VSYADITIVHIRGARALLAWSQTNLVEAAGIATSTIKKIESNAIALGNADSATKRAIFDAFSQAGIAFYGDGEPGARLMAKPQPITGP
jgi:DNA-binding XRE family transcriptional regulator